MPCQAMAYKILILDDDDICLEINKKYIELFSSRCNIAVDILCYSKTDSDFNKQLQSGSIQLAILDIALDGMNGIEIAKKFIQRNPNTLIIFVTNHSEFALDAFEILAFGFIRKPINQTIFETLFNRAMVHIGNQDNDDFLELVVNKENVIIRQSIIIFAEKVRQKTLIKTVKGIYEVYDTISSIERKLNTSFIRINQGVIVNKRKVIEMKRSSIYMSSGEVFSIGRTYSKIIKEEYKKDHISK